MSRRGCKGQPTGRIELVQHGHGGTPRQCIRCGRRIFYGDRYPPCQQQLRQRQRRKPR